jgi:tRNA (cmo5U34)-methyltransferase
MARAIDKSGGNKVDQTLSVIPGGWRFDETIAQHFDSHVRKSIPHYDDVQKLCADVSEWFVTDDCVVYDLGCATGETMLQIAAKFEGKRNLHLVGVDESAAMLQHARQKLRGCQATFLEQRLSAQSRFQGATFIAALYTLQFVFLEERLKILSNIYADLKTGGALFLVEKCLSEKPQIQEIWSGLYYDFKLAQGFSNEEIVGKTLSLRGVMTPITATENERALRAAGFGVVDRITQWGPFIAFLAVKSAGAPVAGATEAAG